MTIVGEDAREPVLVFHNVFVEASKLAGLLQTAMTQPALVLQLIGFAKSTVKHGCP